MALTPENPAKAPGHTCPHIDRVKSIVRKLARTDLTPEHRAALRDEAFKLLEDLREANTRLRALAAEPDGGDNV